MTVVTPADRPKSARSRCVIEVLVAFLCCPFVFEFSVGIRDFCHRIVSDLLLFLFVKYTRRAKYDRPVSYGKKLRSMLIFFDSRPKVTIKVM